MIELFHNHASTCSQKVRICLAEKGLDYVSHHIDLSKFEHIAPDYLAINPNGLVPAMRHNGEVLIKSTVICEYIDEVFPAPALSPSTPAGRAHMRAWLRFIDEVPSMAVRVPTFQRLILPSYQKMSSDEFARIADSMPVRKQFILRMGQDGFDSSEYQASIEQLDRTIKRMEKALKSRPWLVGEHYTIADICAAPLFHRMAELGMTAIWKADAPRVTKWYQAIAARPSFDKAFYDLAELSHYHPALRDISDVA